MLTPVILFGRSSACLWSLSRENEPKRFLALAGLNTMPQETVHRLDGFDAKRQGVAPSFIATCNAAHRFMVAEQLRAAGNDGARIILEPIGCNTAPALALD